MSYTTIGFARRFTYISARFTKVRPAVKVELIGRFDENLIIFVFQHFSEV